MAQITTGQRNLLLLAYLKKVAKPAFGYPTLSVACIATGKMFGMFGLRGPGGATWCQSFLLMDLAIQSDESRLSKLVLAMVLSKETKAILEQRYAHGVDVIGTLCFTDRPSSMKYRGLFEVHEKKPGKILYAAKAGRWTLEEAFAWWQKTQAK